MTSGAWGSMLGNALERLNVLRHDSGSVRKELIHELISSVYDLGKAMSGSPELSSDAAFRRFLDESVAVLKGRYLGLEGYPWWVVRQKFQDRWEYNEWEQLCVARSGIQFFVELFRETAIAEDVSSMDTTDIDEFIRERGTDEGYLSDEDIPPEIPVSHWWWWYPSAPRIRK